MAVFKNSSDKSFAFIENNDELKKVKDVNEFIKNAKGSKKSFQNIKGRPKLNDDQKRTEQVMIYLTKSQKDELTKKASQNNLSISKYVSIKIFGID
ncbi:TPA: hypothetical protein RPW15_000185 [Campylobacter fetus subsp. venerealis]|uniref:hypothetical protein n=1 Tax=Campylobacter fetus TaxID=196 RepID=UPI00190D76DE|nr:hypothetical protein [Campylobacter fetus]MBK3487531.1 hypothetical protein [Campylobacter fetus subsp. venerealis]HDX6281759.1 hypothetical protein [Campylobacter fetus subsp. venerealis]HDX6283884.1 hypothetical protein [Campylobacter fetus subsp. venerealis]HDX6285986.1 hypothetical protein [Campylobacter fetus subsp. venerealis]HDX6287878.1 hypothetical protein [Campylobacter fetus subsp. venerealis]